MKSDLTFSDGAYCVWVLISGDASNFGEKLDCCDLYCESLNFIVDLTFNYESVMVEFVLALTLLKVAILSFFSLKR